MVMLVMGVRTLYCIGLGVLLLFVLCNAHDESCGVKDDGTCNAHSHEHSHKEHSHAHHQHEHAHEEHSHSHLHSHSHSHAHSHETVTCNHATESATCVARFLSSQVAELGTRATYSLNHAQAALLWSAISGMLSAILVSFLPISSTGVFARLLQPFAAGALLADCALHLLPATATASGGTYLLLGVLCMFVLDACARHLSGGHCSSHSNRVSAAVVNLAADAVHNFADGLAIGAAFSASRRAGAATALAVLAHELPQEAADFAVLLRAGWKRWFALTANVACAAVSLAGTAAALALESAVGEKARDTLLPLAAGALLYLALAAILPEVVREINEDDKGKSVGGLRMLGRLIAAVGAAAVGVAGVAAVELLHDH